MSFAINPDMENALDTPENVDTNAGNENTDNNGVDPNKDGDGIDDPGNNGNGAGNPNTDDPNKGADVDPEKKIENVDVIEPSEEQVAEFLRKKGGKFEKIEDLLQERTAAPAENPYSTVIENPEVKNFLDYVKDTGRGFTDYLKLQENINDISDIDLAIAKAKSELGEGLTREDLAAYIEEKTNVDIDSLDELTELEKRKVALFVKDYKNNLLAEQEKYKSPLAKENPGNEGIEMITLDNGQQVEKSIYEDHLKKHQAYQKDMQVAVDSVAPTSLSVEFDNNGTKETLTFDYEYDADDKKNMISLSADIDQTAAKLFNTDKGFNHAGFAKAIWRLDEKNWEKEVSAIVNKAIADTTLKLQENENNIDFNRNRIPNAGKNSKQDDIFKKQNVFGVTFDI